MSKRALHNALFVAVVANNKRLAIELLKFLLGKEKAARFLFRTLKFEKTVFTDAEGNERRADAVITVMTKDRRRVVFLIEHKSVQRKNILQQLLSYQTVLYDESADEIVPIVVSTASGRWRLARRFRAKADDICGEVTLDFGYLLFDLADCNKATLQANFPNSFPRLLGLQVLRQPNNRESVEDFFAESLAMPAEARLKLTAQVTNSVAESDGGFSMGMLEEIEAGCIKDKGNRLMRTVKIGFEGWQEKGFKKGMAKGEAKGKAEGKAEVALRLLEEGISIEVICRTTGLKQGEVKQLKRKQA